MINEELLQNGEKAFFGLVKPIEVVQLNANKHFSQAMETLEDKDWRFVQYPSTSSSQTVSRLFQLAGISKSRRKKTFTIKNPQNPRSKDFVVFDDLNV